MLFFFLQNANAQDTLIFKSGTKETVSITKETKDEIYYRNFNDSLSKSSFIVNKQELTSIIYMDGTKKIIVPDSTYSSVPVPLANNYNFFIQIGGGSGTFHSVGGFSAGVEMTYIIRKHFFSIRNFKSRGAGGKDILGGFSNPKERGTDYGLLYGRAYTRGRVALSFSVGIAYTRGVYRGEKLSSTGGGGSSFINFGGSSDYEEKKFSTIGIPFEAEILFGAKHDVNFDLVFFGNYNKEIPFGGFLLCFRMGKVK